MTHTLLWRHILPHAHEGVHKRALAISLPALFIYLAILLLLTAGLYLIRVKAPQILGTVTFTSDQIIQLTNSKRSQNNLQPFTYNALLASAAAAKAKDMLAADYWAHNSPSGKTPWSFITAAGYRYIFAGENLARDFNDPGSVVDAWMNSPSHRSNLLDNNFREIGVAVTYGKLGGKEGTLVVQMFGSGVSQIPPSQPLALASPAVFAASPLPTAGAVAQVVGQSPAPTPEALASPRAEESVITPSIESFEALESQQTTVLASSKFSIARGVSLALVGFIFALFALEVAVTLKRAHLQLRSSVIAHMGILGFVLFAVWYAVAGAVI
ncbi:hypothetical protein HYU92_06325 [Candidatus Curtissbacteria bacterium]|nr:hypothetical protein [Candidatus Curtissbacteria bacterium]